jgi:hypothetical protein
MHHPRFSSFFLAGCTILLSLVSPVRAIETVSIYSLTPTNEHQCVTSCLWNNLYEDVGYPLLCGHPYANNCYCATNSVSASKASAFLSKCGSSSCAAGDLSNDLTAMQSIYASYCMNAGYTQPGATAWFTMEGAAPTPTGTATPGQRTSSGPQETTVPTTTQVTLVTQTVAASSAPGTSRPQGKSIALLLLLAVGAPLVL